MNSRNVILGVLAGISVGAMLGILLAPDKGSETRKKILETGEDFVDALKEKVNEILGDVNEKFDNVKQDVRTFAEKRRDKKEELTREVKNALN